MSEKEYQIQQEELKIKFLQGFATGAVVAFIISILIYAL